MQQLEPTYLRYVYDGLSKGTISSKNPTSLPSGFIGLFEDEFPSSMSLLERMTVLNRLATWALFKDPVSIEMFADVRNEHPDNTTALVDSYSKWFNSPEPGKYVLYHDRLRTYLLQKLSDYEVQDLNEKLINYLENALKTEGLKEAQTYALEHLSTHMAVESQMGKNYERLHDYVNQEELWKRQINTSNEYKWSKKCLQYSIKESSRRHKEENSILACVNLVSINRLEQKDFEQIISFYNDDEFDIVLNRLESLDIDNRILIITNILYRLTHNDLQKLEFNKVFTEKLSILLNDATVKTESDLSSYCSQLQIYFIYKKLKTIDVDLSFMWDGRNNFKKEDIINNEYTDHEIEDILKLTDVIELNDKIQNNFYETQEISTHLKKSEKSYQDCMKLKKKLNSEKWEDNFEEFFILFEQSDKYEKLNKHKFEFLFKGVQGYKYNLYSGSDEASEYELYFKEFPQLSFELSKMSYLLSGISYDFNRLLNSLIESDKIDVAFDFLKNMKDENSKFYCDESMRFIPSLRLINEFYLNNNIKSILELISTFQNKIIRIDLLLETYILFSSSIHHQSNKIIFQFIQNDVKHIKFRGYLDMLIVYKISQIQNQTHLTKFVNEFEINEDLYLSEDILDCNSKINYKDLFNDYDSRGYNSEIETDNYQLNEEINLFFNSIEELPEKVDRGIKIISNNIFDVDFELGKKVFNKTKKIISEYTFDEPNRCLSLKYFIENSISNDSSDYLIDAADLITDSESLYFDIFNFFAHSKNFEACLEISKRLDFLDHKIEILNNYYEKIFFLFTLNPSFTHKILNDTNHSGYKIKSYCPKKYNSDEILIYDNKLEVQKVYSRLAIYIVKLNNDFKSCHNLLTYIDDTSIKLECLRDLIDYSLIKNKEKTLQLLQSQLIYKHKMIDDNLMVKNYLSSKIDAKKKVNLIAIINKIGDIKKRNETLTYLIEKLIDHEQNFDLINDLIINIKDADLDERLSHLSILYAKKKCFDESQKILELLPEDKLLLDKYLKSETALQIAYEMVKAGLLNQSLNIINSINQQSIKNKFFLIFFQDLIGYLDVNKPENELKKYVDLINNEWLKLDVNIRPSDEIIKSYSVKDIIELLLNKIDLNNTDLNNIILHTKSLFKENNISLFDKSNLLIKLYILFKKNNNEIYYDITELLKNQINQIKEVYSEVAISKNIDSVITDSYEYKFIRIWKLLNSFKISLDIRFKYFLMFIKNEKVIDTEIDLILKDLDVLKNHCSAFENNENFKGKFFRNTEDILNTYGINAEHHLMFSTEIATKLIHHFSSTNQLDYVDKVYSKFYLNKFNTIDYFTNNPFYYESLFRKKEKTFERLVKLRKMKAPDIVLKNETNKLNKLIVDDINYCFDTLNDFKLTGNEVLFSYLKNKIYENLKITNKLDNQLSKNISSQINFLMAKFYISIDFKKSLFHSNKIEIKKLYLKYLMEVYTVKGLRNTLNIKTNSIKNNKILSQKISNTIFQNGYTENDFFIYLSNFNKNIDSLESLFENKLYYEISCNKITKDKLDNYSKLFDLKVLKSVVLQELNAL